MEYPPEIVGVCICCVSRGICISCAKVPQKDGNGKKTRVFFSIHSHFRLFVRTFVAENHKRATTMIPIQYFISPADVREALATGCRWVLLADCPSDFESALCDCRAAGCLLTVCDDAETVRDAVADGLLLTSSGIAALAARRPEPSGIVLQRPHPVTSAVHVARGILGEDSPQIIGVAVDNASDVVAAAKAGADYVLLPAHAAIGIAAEVRRAGCGIHMVAHFEGDITPDDAFQILGSGLHGIACHIRHVPPSALPVLLHADE